MMPGTGETRGRQALAALTEMAQMSVQPPTQAQLDQGLDALTSFIAAGQARRHGLLRWSVVATATAAACAVIGIVWLAHPHMPAAPPALSYQINGGSLVEGGYLRESAHAGIKLSFTEGTEFILMPGTRSRLRTVDNSGARIAIEQGTASFRVTPANERKWLIDVGPFLVTVKGTIFTVSWDASSERFDLQLQQGRVTVSGPVSGGDIALRAGQRLRVDLSRGETVITDQKPDEAWLEDWSAPSVPTAVTPKERPAVASAGVAKLDGERRWAEALAAGHLDRILAEAERTGVKATLEKASSDDLLALADAARYRRRMDLARDALLAERRRFPGSPRSLDATFLLGRVEETSEIGMARAIEWYNEYLTRTPHGTYTSEALGRKMTLTTKLQGNDRARPIAEEYLRRFPNGTYAGPARALLRAP